MTMVDNVSNVKFHLCRTSSEVSFDCVVGSNLDQVVDVAGRIQMFPDGVAYLNKKFVHFYYFL